MSDVRERFLSFYENRGHKIIPSASLIPENDQTTLFTGSGMQPMVPYLLGESHPLGSRIVDSQKCFRAEDIEEVGDNRHTTFFEMLGNWSLGDYSKDDQLPWIFEFLTNTNEGLGIDPSRLYATVFLGDEEQGLPKDDESAHIWERLFEEKGISAKTAVMGSEEEGGLRGIKEGERIFYYDAKKNWWSRAGVPPAMPVGEPGGPDSEVFYEFEDVEHDSSYGEYCHPNCDCGRFLEIGNSVFMQYVKTDSGFQKLPKENVDFGGGLERLAAVAIGANDIFDVDIFQGLLAELEKHAGKKYSDKNAQTSFRIIADHIRGAVFMIADGVLPSNTEQGYFVRRLLRRSIRHADTLGIDEGALVALVPILVHEYGEVYPEIESGAAKITAAIRDEEQKFRKTLARGLREFDKIANKEKEISGKSAFLLFSTYGFPIELTEEIAVERGVGVDREAFDVAFREHQEASRKGSEKKFKGGLGDASEMSVKYHTATHLLNAALRTVLGGHVEQRGSNITPERMRFDFSHSSKLTNEEIQRVEQFVNEAIKSALPVTHSEMSIDDARSRGALGVFSDRYDDIVKVYVIGSEDDAVSIEICGGPHVANTSELGVFRIQKEEASSAGVRRIKAVLE